MRLSKIKLAGFKSFVDPTLINFPSNRVGVVGPNGCGKSNVIDAVRWVMGESSAKNLRGGAMTDVIFNGSVTRPAIEEAAIELVFGQVDLPQYPEHEEISVRRELTRQGQSSYFLNGIKCRRKDITDLFLGTGLGPRSYAIIEQGTISRFIEAKPEELRIFLEEAAGISKYKERRKETEQHIKQTRDNVARVDEIRGELDKQIQKLQKQAKDAEKYRQLKSSEQLLKAQWQAWRWQQFDQAVQTQEQRIAEQAALLERDLLTLHELDTTHKTQRSARQTLQQAAEQAQIQFYELDNQVNRLTQSMEHSREQKEQFQWDLEELTTELEKTQQQLESNQYQKTRLDADLVGTDTELDTWYEQETSAEQKLQETERQWQKWQSHWDIFNQQAVEPLQQAQVERTRLQNMEQRLAQNQQRLTRVTGEIEAIDLQPLTEAVTQLEAEMSKLTMSLTSAETSLQIDQQAIVQLREIIQSDAPRLHEFQTQVTQLSGRLASLEALQEAALGKDNADLAAWLHVQGLREVPRLAQLIQVESGWERAVEVVLGHTLQALCVEQLPPVSALAQPPQGQLSLFNHQIPVNGEWIKERAGFVPLLTKVQAPWSLHSLFSGIWAIETLSAAVGLCPHLTASESMITPEGIWLGPNWLRSQQGTDERSGVLARTQEIKRVANHLQALDVQVMTLSTHLEQQRLALREHEQQRDQAQKNVNTLRQQLSQLQSQYGGKKAQLEHAKSQLSRLTQEQLELTAHRAQDEQEIKMTQQKLYAALTQTEQLAEERENLSKKRDHLQEAVAQARRVWQEAQSARHQVEIRLESLKNQQRHVQKEITELQSRIEELTEKQYELQRSVEAHSDPLIELEEELATLQGQRETAAEALRTAKQQLQDVEVTLTQEEDTQQTLTARSGELRTTLEQLRMECQANQVRRQTVEEQFIENPPPAPFNQGGREAILALLAELPSQMNEETWQADIDSVERKLQRLGSVNFAALEEFTEQAERKKFLDSQADDLNKSLQLLEDAMRTIDREMRNRFKNTLETVNTNLQAMFPRLFGGGQAKLELIGDDVLKAGVTIMARPPGKRNSTIHLLSGGEKALTAMALVFSIFEINPAPFCMLDEVDAPLDDTNVGRFCALVKAMSERVQFIFISHNKITMEIADQLVGVTMQEAGVSRLVTVDLNTAVEMVGVG